ncbi:pimeloyl-ACP methyl ester carboxylesterase [Desulfuromonas soudanensis]|uniref:Pimeloyl-ACP methyl ester carboxylesterase n=1 Tax=Desulfuromonas soudanensis TaxID=1603606 RepID=A0A0M4CZI8_9BACT|nr:alpha/beta fold hydrolase [Desulfuromonas soudanensis]ALC18141.1 pimeloyl-ACP methyl ester carboxylesterase [Desulfuromonas soudanensis]
MKARINGIELAWDDTGGAGTAVLLIHGYPLCRRMWRPQVAALAAAGYRVITPDLRGFGESEAPGGAVSMELYADDLLALLDHLGLEKAVIGGMSMGGYVLLDLLARHRQRFSAALFIVTRAGGDDAEGKARRARLAATALAEGALPVADAFAGLVFASGTAGSRPELVREVRSWMEGTSPGGLAAGLLAMADRVDFTSRLSELTLPALVIGAEEDRAIPPAESRRLAEGLPEATLVILPGGGHLVNLECSEAFNGALLGFLGRV